MHGGHNVVLPDEKETVTVCKWQLAWFANPTDGGVAITRTIAPLR